MSMGGVFFSKKQKARMRERRKRKHKQVEENECAKKGDDYNDLHPAESSSNTAAAAAAATTTTQELSYGPIILPANLSGKEARKFRKDARRKARTEGHDETKLVFVMEGQQEQEQDSTSEPPRKRKKTYPRINDLLQKQKEEELQQKEEEKRRKEEERVPEEVKQRYVALDCEMVGIGTDGKQSALARVSLTDWYGEIVLDTFVQVPSKVTDFRTFVSGVKPKDISTKTAMDVVECRKQVAELLHDKILVGHALKNDLQALLLNHPKHNIRDTAKYRPFQRASGRNGGKWRPRKLRDLVKEHLNRTIQIAGESHDSTEDARATMDLFKRVRTAWEKELDQAARKKKK
jgi:RNA exonuclease 4